MAKAKIKYMHPEDDHDRKVTEMRRESMFEVQQKVEAALLKAGLRFATKSMRAHWVKPDGKITARFRYADPELYLVGIFVTADFVKKGKT
jgi:hypothetical protein